MSLISQYRSNDDAASTVVVDNRLAGNNGTAQQNTEDINVAGKINGALSFNGSTDYINCGTDSSLDIDGNDFSFALWAKRAGAMGSLQFFAGKGTTVAEDNLMHIGFDASDFIRFNFFQDDLTSGTAITDNNYHHYVFTFKASTKARKIYLDANLNASDTASGVIANSNTDPLIIGARDTSNLFFEGDLDDVRFYDTELSLSEIQAIYNNDNGTETNPILVSGSFDGQSTLSGAVKVTRNISGSFDGAVTSTGSLEAVKKTTGSFAGASAFTGAVSITKSVVGSFVGVSSFSGAVGINKSIAGSFVGLSSFSGNAYIAKYIAGSFAGAFAFIGTLSRLWEPKSDVTSASWASPSESTGSSWREPSKTNDVNWTGV